MPLTQHAPGPEACILASCHRGEGRCLFHLRFATAVVSQAKVGGQPLPRPAEVGGKSHGRPGERGAEVSVALASVLWLACVEVRATGLWSAGGIPMVTGGLGSSPQRARPVWPTGLVAACLRPSLLP